MESAARGTRVSERMVPWLCGAVGAIAVLDLAGWMLGIPRLTSLFTTYATMKPNTALGLGVLALVCLLKRREGAGRGARLAAAALAALVGALAVTTIFEYAFGYDLRLDGLVMRVAVDAFGGHAGRMSLGTAISLSLVATALLAMDLLPRLSTTATLTALGISLSALIGFVFNAGPLFGVPWLRSLAVHTACGLLLLELALLAARPQREPYRSLADYGRHEGRIRWVMPGVTILPLAIALPLLEGLRAGWYDAPFALAMLVVLLTAIQTFIVWQDSRALAAVEERRRVTEQALMQTEKLAVVGRLSASIAHEINNPLDAVMNLLYLMRTENSLEQIHAYAQQSEEELARVTQIASQTLSFFRGSKNRAECGVGEILTSAMKLLSSKVKASGVTSTMQLAEPDLLLACKEGEMRQVFINLISNAVEATVAGGHLVIRVRRSREWKSLRPGVRVVIADSGCGMSMAICQSIFQPFFTTKDQTGNGLGLWVAKDLVEKQGGFIRVWSSTRAGRSGTSFCVFLPLQ